MTRTGLDDTRGTLSPGFSSRTRWGGAMHHGSASAVPQGQGLARAGRHTLSTFHALELVLPDCSRSNTATATPDRQLQEQLQERSGIAAYGTITNSTPTGNLLWLVLFRGRNSHPCSGVSPSPSRPRRGAVCDDEKRQTSFPALQFSLTLLSVAYPGRR